VALLEQQYVALSDEVGTLGEETKRTADELSKALEGERNDRQQGDKAIRDQLKKAVAEGIPLEFTGALFIAIGILADDGDQRAVRFEGDEGSAQVIQRLHGALHRCISDGCSILAAAP
jgi:hypothetical protein